MNNSVINNIDLNEKVLLLEIQNAAVERAKLLWQDKMYNLIVMITNYTSIILGGLALLFVVSIYFLGKTKQNRLTYPLAATIIFIDVLYSVFHISTLYWPDGGPGCVLTLYGYLFSALSSQLLSFCIALNLQIVVIHQINIDRKSLQIFYFSLSILLSIILPLLPVVLNIAGFDKENNTCWYIDETKFKTIAWEFSTFYGWTISIILYCSIIAISIYSITSNRLRKLKNNIKFLSVNNGYSVEDVNRLKKEYKVQSRLVFKVIRRIVLYPLVPTFGFSLTIIASIYQFYSKKPTNFYLAMFMFATRGLQGTADFFILLLDPVIQNTWHNTKISLISQYYPILLNYRDENEIRDEDTINRHSIQNTTLTNSSNSMSKWETIIKKFVYYVCLSKEQKHRLNNFNDINYGCIKRARTISKERKSGSNSFRLFSKNRSRSTNFTVIEEYESKIKELDL